MLIFILFYFPGFDSHVFNLLEENMWKKKVFLHCLDKKKITGRRAILKLLEYFFLTILIIYLFFFCSSSKTMNLCSKCFAGEFLFLCMWVLLTHSEVELVRVKVVPSWHWHVQLEWTEIFFKILLHKPEPGTCFAVNFLTQYSTDLSVLIMDDVEI